MCPSCINNCLKVNYPLHICQLCSSLYKCKLVQFFQNIQVCLNILRVFYLYLITESTRNKTTVISRPPPSLSFPYQYCILDAHLNFILCSTRLWVCKEPETNWTYSITCQFHTVYGISTVNMLCTKYAIVVYTLNVKLFKQKEALF